MTSSITPLTKRASWKALEAHHAGIRDQHLRKLFADDPKRGERLTAEALGIYLDYSKNRITDETPTLLPQLAEEIGAQLVGEGSVTVSSVNTLEDARAGLAASVRELEARLNSRRYRMVDRLHRHSRRIPLLHRTVRFVVFRSWLVAKSLRSRAAGRR